MHVRLATAADLEVVTALRLRFLAEHRQVEPSHFPGTFQAATYDFLHRHDAARTSRNWLAEHGGVAVGVVTMLLLDLAPRPEDTTGQEGYILNMYVLPSHRRHGIGRALLSACIDAAAELSLRRLLLYATDDGHPLYASAGFTPNPRWMERRT